MVPTCNRGATYNDQSTATDTYLRLGMNNAGAATGGSNDERGSGVVGHYMNRRSGSLQPKVALGRAEVAEA
jgi:hypothetical protein